MNQCPSHLFDTEEDRSRILFGGDYEEKNTSNGTASKKDLEQPPISTFEEWTKQKLEQEKQRKIQVRLDIVLLLITPG